MSGDVLARLGRRELDVGFFLDLPHDPLDATYRLRPLTRFTYRVLAPAGWGPQVRGKDWKALAALPWLATPPASAHHRLQRRVFGPGSLTGLEPRRTGAGQRLGRAGSGVGLTGLNRSAQRASMRPLSSDSTISTRRFIWRPAALALSLTGEASP